MYQTPHLDLEDLLRNLPDDLCARVEVLVHPAQTRTAAEESLCSDCAAAAHRVSHVNRSCSAADQLETKYAVHTRTRAHKKAFPA